MPVYRYKALDVRGDLLEGQMEAASEAEVAARLQEQGHVPVEASLSNGDAIRPSLRNFLGEKPFSGLGLISFHLTTGSVARRRSAFGSCAFHLDGSSG